jgi:hypothetical protein
MFGIMHYIKWIGYPAGEFAIARHTQKHTTHCLVFLIEFHTVFPGEMMGYEYNIGVFTGIGHDIEEWSLYFGDYQIRWIGFNAQIGG